VSIIDAIDQIDPADAKQLRTALATIDLPISIKRLALTTRNDSMAVARALRQMCIDGETIRLVAGERTVYWPSNRPLPPNWQSPGRTEPDATTVHRIATDEDQADDAIARATEARAKKPNQPTTGAQMPYANATPATVEQLSPALREVYDALHHFTAGAKPMDLAAKLNILRPACSVRLTNLRKRGLAISRGKTASTRWFAVEQNTSTAAPSEAKMLGTPRQQTTLKAPRKASLETLDAALRDKNNRRTAGPAIIDGINTRDFLEPPGEDDDTAIEAVALTDKHELLILSNNRVAQVIESATALRLVAFLRTLPSDHALALQA